jgi:hypothetical protein
VERRRELCRPLQAGSGLGNDHDRILSVKADGRPVQDTFQLVTFGAHVGGLSQFQRPSSAVA